jgi:hypothetical protein
MSLDGIPVCTPHHDLVFGGIAPWPIAPTLRLRDIQADPGARCCRGCGASLLLLLLGWSSWVSHRTEHVTFRDDRSVVRRVTVEFHTPDQAPVFRGDDGQDCRLVPLSIMRRKTLVNFTLCDDSGRSVVVPTLRQNQAITESVLLACADATLGQGGDGTAPADAAGRRAIARFIYQVVSGDQRELTAAYESLDRGTAAPAVRDLVGRGMFRTLLDRLADNFVLWVMIPAGAPRRRVLNFSFDEPLQLRYRKPGFVGDTYELGKKLNPWHPVVWRSALGFTTTRVRFPVPAVENTDSFHFEIEAPKGVEIAEASLLAGRPGQAEPPEHLNPSFDRVRGGFPTAGLHVIEVPNGSLSRAQVGLQVVTRGWLMTSMLSAWAVFGLLVAYARFTNDLKQDSGAPALILAAVAAGVAALIAQSVSHGLAAHLLKWARALATVSAALPLIVATSIVLEPARSGHVSHVLWGAIGSGGAIALVLTSVCLLSWLRQRTNARSPWEQNRSRKDMPPLPADFDKAAVQYRYNKPAMRVDSAEGWHTEFVWTDHAENELTRALHALYPDHSGRHYVGQAQLGPA